MTQIRWGKTIDGVALGTARIFDGPTFDQTSTAPYPALGNPWAPGVSGFVQDYQPLAVAGSAPAGSLSINLATGQNAAGVIQLTGDMPDANWTVSKAETYKQAPIAFTVAPGYPDWFTGDPPGGNPAWFANGPNSCWIASDPDVHNDGANITYTTTFNLGNFDPADATLQGGQFSIDDQGYVYLNGHEIGAALYYGNWGGFTALSNGAGDFVAGVNTITIQTVNSDDYDSAARFEGTVIDSVTLGPGPIHWASDVSGSFDTASDWNGGLIPGPNNGAILDASGSTPYTVTASTNNAVETVQTDATATLDITSGVFAVSAGGANAGAIQIEAGAALSLGGTLSNQGVLATGVNGAAGAATIDISQSTTLKGGGEVIFGAATTNQITGGGSAATLTNINNTISGSGLIGGGDLTLVNEAKGVIDGSTNGITIDASGGTDTNAGLIESAGGLTLRNGSFSNGGSVDAGGAFTLNDATLDDTSGGKLQASAGIKLTNSAILGGALSLASGAVLGAYGADTLTASLTNAGTVTIEGGANLSLQGALTNDGEIGFANSEPAATLTIDTGANTISNAGVIKADGNGTVVIDGAVNNIGKLKVRKGTMTVDGAVTGSGRAVIVGGTMEFAGAFDETVKFVLGTGELVLGQSQSFSGPIAGFSASGGTSLDLRDIGFVDAGEATFSGNTHSGVLTVTDGTHTASIRLIGDYTSASFVASSDSDGGTMVVTQAGALRFAAAAAGLGGGSAESAGSSHTSPEPHLLTLALPTSTSAPRSGSFQFA